MRLLLALAACYAASNEDLVRLEARVAALETRIAEGDAPSGVRTQGSGSAGPMRQEAGERQLEAARVALDVGDVTSARKKLREITLLYPESAAARTATQLLEAVQIVGTPIRTLAVTQWLQGTADIDPAAPTLVLLFDASGRDALRDIGQVDRVARLLHDEGLDVVGLVRLSEAASIDTARNVLTEGLVAFPVGVESEAGRALFAQSSLPTAILVRNGVAAWVDHPSRFNQATARRLLRASLPG